MALSSSPVIILVWLCCGSWLPTIMVSAAVDSPSEGSTSSSNTLPWWAIFLLCIFGVTILGLSVALWAARRVISRLSAVPVTVVPRLETITGTRRDPAAATSSVDKQQNGTNGASSGRCGIVLDLEEGPEPPAEVLHKAADVAPPAPLYVCGGKVSSAEPTASFPPVVAELTPSPPVAPASAPRGSPTAGRLPSLLFVTASAATTPSPPNNPLELPGSGEGADAQQQQQPAATAALA
eukprot:RCo044974